MADPLVHVLVAGAGGVLLSVLLEQGLQPRPRLARPWRAWALHAGLWLLPFGALVLALGRPWFAAAAVNALILLLVLVSNAKYRVLREPFVFMDYEYFTDALRHPRLYIPFFGWGKALLAAITFALAVWIGLTGETVPAARFRLAGQAGGIVGVFLLSCALLALGSRPGLRVSLRPDEDLAALGLLACLWSYGVGHFYPPEARSAFSRWKQGAHRGRVLPHLMAVQSESFFDPRPLYGGISLDVLGRYDNIKAQAAAYGSLKVPAWGANTVRTEFAFLTGLDENSLGVHRFNPYQAIKAGWRPGSLATYLRSLGYRTVCVHPYLSDFYGRNRVLPALGFDEFLDIRAFAHAPRFGPYVSDLAVTEIVGTALRQATAPVFVFVITMENHGPLHLEKVNAADVAALYTRPPPPGCDDLTVYLRHLRNADQMIGRLTEMLAACGRPAGLCWYGDHVPIMPSVYARLGEPDGTTEYLLWAHEGAAVPKKMQVSVHELALLWLRTMGAFGPDLDATVPQFGRCGFGQQDPVATTCQAKPQGTASPDGALLGRRGYPRRPS